MIHRRGVIALALGFCFALFPVVQCGFGEIHTEGEPEGCPYGCPPGMVCIERACFDPAEGCEGVVCDPGYVCMAGYCFSDDPCAEIVCDAGSICQGGQCVSGEADSDGDGFLAWDDCDDFDPSVHPGGEETCDGVDQDCDGDVDEGFDADLDGHSTCGGGLADAVDCDDDDPNVHPAMEELCNGSDDDCDGAVDEEIEPRSCSNACGEGEERCVEGEWLCDVLAHCDCLPPETDSRACGRCGTETRRCNADNTWGDYEGCVDEGPCTAGQVENQECGNCGTQSRSCADNCQWGSWSSCVDERSCSPGQLDTSGTCDDCSHRVCDDYCRWGPCEVRPENECEWRAGTNYRCCGDSRWQYCLSSCRWSTDCASCSGCC